MFRLLLVGCLILYCLGDTLRSTYDPPKMIHLALTEKPDEMVITWTTNLPAKSSAIIYKAKDASSTRNFTGSSSTYLPSAGWTHNVIVTDLDPSTEYVYTCGSLESGFSVENSFTSAPTPGTRDPRKFVIYGDMGIFQYSYFTVQHVTRFVANNPVDLIYHSGDFGYGDNRPAEYYETSWNVFFEQMTFPMLRVPYMVAAGNHEHQCGSDQCNFYAYNFTVYNNRFRMPSQTFPTPSNMWFSFDYGNVHWITISTETDFPHCPYSSSTFGDQLGWLEADLKIASANPKIDWIFATGHQPIYSSVKGKSNIFGVPEGSTRNVQQAFEDLFHQYKVDLYIDGHVHGYERSYPVYHSTTRGNFNETTYEDPEATVYIVNGSAGNIEGFYDSWNENIPEWSAKRYWPNPRHGFGTLDVSGNEKVSWTWYENADDGSSKVYDTFEIIKTSSAPSAFPN